MRTNYFKDYAELELLLGKEASQKLENFLFTHHFTGPGYLSYRRQQKLIREMRRDLKAWKKKLCCRTTCHNYQKKFSKHIYSICCFLFSYIEGTCNSLFILT
jgi:hypothetical protein